MALIILSWDLLSLYTWALLNFIQGPAVLAKIQCRCSCLCFLNQTWTCIVALLPILSPALSPADSFKRILNKEFLQRQRTWWGSHKSVHLLILWLCKKTDEQWQELKKMKVMLLRPGTAAFCVGHSVWALVQRSTTEFGGKCATKPASLYSLDPRPALLEESITDAFLSSSCWDLAKEPNTHISRNNPSVCSLFHPTLGASSWNVLCCHPGMRFIFFKCFHGGREGCVQGCLWHHGAQLRGEISTADLLTSRSVIFSKVIPPVLWEWFPCVETNQVKICPFNFHPLVLLQSAAHEALPWRRPPQAFLTHFCCAALPPFCACSS